MGWLERRTARAGEARIAAQAGISLVRARALCVRSARARSHRTYQIDRFGVRGGDGETLHTEAHACTDCRHRAPTAAAPRVVPAEAALCTSRWRQSARHCYTRQSARSTTRELQTLPRALLHRFVSAARHAGAHSIQGEQQPLQRAAMRVDRT